MTQLMGGIESASQPAKTMPKPKRINPYAACVVQFGHSGKLHLYLNAAVPDGCHPAQGICDTCKHAYSHLARSSRTTCRECELDKVAARAAKFEDAGIDMGWGFTEHSREYERDRQNLNSRNVWRYSSQS